MNIEETRLPKKYVSIHAHPCPSVAQRNLSALSRHLLCLLASCFLLTAASAHEAPTSFIDFRITPAGLDATLTASVTDLAHDLPSVEPAMLLRPEILAQQKSALIGLLNSRLQISADGLPLPAEWSGLEALPEKRDLRLALHCAWTSAPAVIRVQSRLFPYDPRHRTFLNFYTGDHLERQEIAEGDARPLEFQLGSGQSIGAVVHQFIFEGIHHIFLGPDHILFIIGLLLLGGGIGRLLKIVTAFTIAHSITLGLATFRLVSPPASFIEPAIALSIVFVGLHTLLGKKGHDPRMLFAFGFGLIHGFGFANALQEMMLPRHALGWSLFAFNFGVELGQMCIVLAVAPLLALLRSKSAPLAERVVTAGSLIVTTAGAFWFFQRILP